MTQLTNPTNEQELRYELKAQSYYELLLPKAKELGVPLEFVEWLVYTGLEALINGEIAKVLDRFEQDCRLHYTTWGNSEKMLQVSGVLKHIQAERAKLKEVK